jgi:hypothetical protein
MKCVRHLCQAAPRNTAPIALLSPSWASQDDQAHSVKPAGPQAAQEGGPEGAVLGVELTRPR